MHQKRSTGSDTTQNVSGDLGTNRVTIGVKVDSIERKRMAMASRKKHFAVEQCCPLRLRDLILAGVSFEQSASGTLTWSESDLVLNFTVLPAGPKTYLALAPPVQPVPLHSRQSFELMRSSCNFGGVRFWFSCPGFDRQTVWPACGGSVPSSWIDLIRLPNVFEFDVRESADPR